MNSHEYANWLQRLAEFLLSRPQFDLYLGAPKIHCYFGSDKPKFLRAAKSLGAIKKTYTERPRDIEVAPVAFPEFIVYASRDVVCRKVQEEKWECEPLLSQDEESEIGDGKAVA